MSKISISQIFAIVAFGAFVFNFEKIAIFLVCVSCLIGIIETVVQKKTGGIPVNRIKKHLENSHFHVPYIAPVSKVLDMFGLSRASSLSKAQSEYLSRVVSKLGYRIEPDVRMTGKKYNLDEYVCIYSDYNKFPITINYRIAVLFAELGYKVLMADDDVSKSEKWFLERTLTEEFKLNPAEKVRLQQKLELMSYGFNTQSGVILRRLLQQADNKSRLSIADFVIAVAASDGVIHVKEIDLLKKIFKQLGFSESDLMKSLELLKENRTSLTFQERVSASSRRKQSSEPIVATEPEKIELRLDPEKLSRVMLNTSDIHKTLETIFADEQTAELREISVERNASSPQNTETDEDSANRFENETDEVNDEEENDELYGENEPELIDVLIEQEEWTKEELLDLIENTGKMLSSYVDEVNEWSEEEYGDFLLSEEEDGIYSVNEDVVELMRRGE